MIVDRKLFDSLKPKSNVRVVCKCNSCGEKRLVLKFNIRDNENLCLNCNISKNRIHARFMSQKEREELRFKWSGSGNPRWNKDRTLHASVMAARKSCYSILSSALRKIGKRKTARTNIMLGYDAVELRAHIEAKFTDGMNWGNRKEWHIDHIKPVRAFVREGELRMDVINALSNLQPLWAIDNLRKGFSDSFMAKTL